MISENKNLNEEDFNVTLSFNTSNCGNINDKVDLYPLTLQEKTVSKLVMKGMFTLHYSVFGNQQCWCWGIMFNLILI